MIWVPTWRKHAHHLPAMREQIAAHPGGLPPFRFHDGCEVPWDESPNGTDEGLLRFLQARGGDVTKAASMFVRHLEWRRHAFPIRREGRVAEILDDSLPHQQRRFAVMGKNSEGIPIIKFDWMWGSFLTERYSALDCVRACMLFMEETCVMAPTLLECQLVCLSYRGFCPADFGRAFAAILMDNYPERLVRAVVWPVPAVVVKLVRTFIVMFAPAALNEKVSIETEESRMLGILSFPESQLPDYMQGGLEAIWERDKPDLALTKKLVMDGFRTRGKNKALQNWPWSNPIVTQYQPQRLRSELLQDESTKRSFGFLSCFGGCLGREESMKVRQEVYHQRVEHAPPATAHVPALAPATGGHTILLPQFLVLLAAVLIAFLWQHLI